jgi:putative SOS response-associated peptidase YedK
MHCRRLYVCCADISGRTKAHLVESERHLFDFLTTEANDVVGAIHPKAMPVFLTMPAEIETWMTASADEALKLQRPLPDGKLAIVARGERKDDAPALGLVYAAG